MLWFSPAVPAPHGCGGVDGYHDVVGEQYGHAVGFCVAAVERIEGFGCLDGQAVARHDIAVGHALVGIVGRSGLHVDGGSFVGRITELVCVPVGGEV